MAVATTKFVWMDGNFVKWNDAKVHILTHALHYGTSVFEGIHSYSTDNGTAVFRLAEHIERLLFSANSLSMKLPFNKKQLVMAAKELVKVNNISDGYIRPLAYYSYGNVGVFPKDIPASMAIAAVPWQGYYSSELRVVTSKYIRHPEKSSVYGAKIGGNYANSVLAMHEARKKGFDEALMLDIDGYVSEGPAENIFIVKNGAIFTPSSRSALPGITRDSILKVSKDMGIKAYAKKIRLSEAKNADELFFCGTATEIAPIISLDNKAIGNGKAGEATLKIRDKFYEIVRGRNKKYEKWLAYV